MTKLTIDAQLKKRAKNNGGERIIIATIKKSSLANKQKSSINSLAELKSYVLLQTGGGPGGKVSEDYCIS